MGRRAGSRTQAKLQPGWEGRIGTRRFPKLSLSQAAGHRLRITFGPFVGQPGVCTQVSRQQVGVLLLMFKAERQVKLRRDAVELV